MDQRVEIDWAVIEGFIGYGRPDAPVVFIGMEEGLGIEEDLNENLLRRSTYSATMDLWAPRRLLEPSFDSTRVPTQKTWKPMCDLMLRRRGIANPTKEQRKEYQNNALGRSDGETLLAELLPYPSNKNSDWRYAPFGRYLSRKEYEADQIPKRLNLLRTILDQGRPELVICYGRGSWDHYEELFPDAAWKTMSPFKVGRFGRAKVVLTNHFSSRDFNPDVQLARLAEIALLD